MSELLERAAARFWKRHGLTLAAVFLFSHLAAVFGAGFDPKSVPPIPALRIAALLAWPVALWLGPLLLATLATKYWRSVAESDLAADLVITGVALETIERECRTASHQFLVRTGFCWFPAVWIGLELAGRRSLAWDVLPRQGAYWLVSVLLLHEPAWVLSGSRWRGWLLGDGLFFGVALPLGAMLSLLFVVLPARMSGSGEANSRFMSGLLLVLLGSSLAGALVGRLRKSGLN